MITLSKHEAVYDRDYVEGLEAEKTRRARTIITMQQHIEELESTINHDSLYMERAETAEAQLEKVRKWQPIETAPKDGTVHIRGLWVNVKNAPKEFQQFIGFINEDGDFVDISYFDDFGWNADDYTHWIPLQEPPEQEDG